MRIHYFKEKQGNFGDDLNGWMWEALAPGCWEEHGDVAFAGIGTILDQPLPPMRKWYVLGSGVGYGSPPADLSGDRWVVLAVRGPLTAEVLNLPLTAAVTDAAILVAALPNGCGRPLPPDQRRGIVFMPHYKQLRFGRWREVCKAAGIEFISPRDDSVQTLQRLRSAQLVLAGAMHSAICADTLRVPWISVSIGSENNSFKWLDWTLSMEVPYAPYRLPASSLLERLQSWAWVFTGTAFELEENDPRKAVAFYNRVIRQRRNAWMWNARRAINAALLCVQVLSRLPLLRQVYAHFDRLQFERAVSASKAATNAPAQLSGEQVFKTRLREMCDRLEQAKTYREPADA